MAVLLQWDSLTEAGTQGGIEKQEQRSAAESLRRRRGDASG